jgi:hypothetical protein
VQKGIGAVGMQALIGMLVIALALVSAGCASTPDIRSDYDSGAQFASYHTYNFMPGAGPDSSDYQGLFSQYMVDAITIEMEKRGYTKSDNPDLLVNFNGIMQEKTQIRTTPVSTGTPYYTYRRGYYGAWGGYGMATETHVSEYTQGTFNIDLIDAKRKQLVWEAVGVGRVSDEALKNLEAGVKKGVPNYFSRYPFVAGSATPVKTE